MIRYDPATRTIHMDLVNLEHCGFQWDAYCDELHLNGLDDTDPALQWPDTLIVTFREGAVHVAPAPGQAELPGMEDQ